MAVPFGWVAARARTRALRVAAVASFAGTYEYGGASPPILPTDGLHFGLLPSNREAPCGCLPQVMGGVYDDWSKIAPSVFL